MKKIDTSRIRTYSLKGRESKVRVHDFSRPFPRGGSFREFFSSLPDILGAKQLKEVAAAVVQARKDGRPVMLGMGAHSIKVGLNPVIIDLMEKKVITSLSLNGAGIIHDFELAFIGQTSEDVDKEILSGAFGMADETGSMINNAIRKQDDPGKRFSLPGPEPPCRGLPPGDSRYRPCRHRHGHHPYASLVRRQGNGSSRPERFSCLLLPGLRTRRRRLY
jgi:hypothetical protein